MSKTYLNRTQLARRLNIAQATLAKRILAGEIKPDAKDGRGEDLFSEETATAIEKKRSVTK